MLLEDRTKLGEKTKLELPNIPIGEGDQTPIGEPTDITSELSNVPVGGASAVPIPEGEVIESAINETPSELETLGEVNPDSFYKSKSGISEFTAEHAAALEDYRPSKYSKSIQDGMDAELNAMNLPSNTFLGIIGADISDGTTGQLAHWFNDKLHNFQEQDGFVASKDRVRAEFFDTWTKPLQDKYLAAKSPDEADFIADRANKVSLNQQIISDFGRNGATMTFWNGMWGGFADPADLVLGIASAGAVKAMTLTKNAAKYGALLRRQNDELRKMSKIIAPITRAEREAGVLRKIQKTNSKLYQLKNSRKMNLAAGISGGVSSAGVYSMFSYMNDEMTTSQAMQSFAIGALAAGVFSAAGSKVSKAFEKKHYNKEGQVVSAPKREDIKPDDVAEPELNTHTRPEDNLSEADKGLHDFLPNVNDDLARGERRAAMIKEDEYYDSYKALEGDVEAQKTFEAERLREEIEARYTAEELAMIQSCKI